ncbi:MAG: hypothetical protein IPL39_25260 [Opitutaceae bacterium]|nr:hypothetical protein [Opitutaceae bacterium]
MATTLFTQNIIACIWDFDKTLIPEYMQTPLFRRFGIVEQDFWHETNALIEIYRKRGYHVSGENGYLNHLLTCVMHGKLRGLNNRILRECGREIRFYPGLPEFFPAAREWVQEKPEFARHEIKLEHYIVSTGLAEMVRGSAIAPYVDGIWGCGIHREPCPGLRGTGVRDRGRGRDRPDRGGDRQHHQDARAVRDQQRAPTRTPRST